MVISTCILTKAGCLFAHYLLCERVIVVILLSLSLIQKGINNEQNLEMFQKCDDFLFTFIIF